MKDKFKKVISVLTDKYKRTIFMSKLGFYNHISDEKFVKMQFKNVFGYEPDLENPVTYDEKLQWLKLYNHRAEYINMVDKYEVKHYVASIIGEEHIIPTLGVWDSFDEIDFNILPDKFVLKCTHDSGGVVICKDKSQFNISAARKKISASLAKNYYIQNREWPYKHVKRRVIAEKYMVDESGYELKDYKFFCFNGEVKALFTASGRENQETGVKYDFYDSDFNHLPINTDENSYKPLKCPDSFEQMKYYAGLLSRNIPHVRVDFYDINGKLYFGELTFFHLSGFERFDPPHWNKVFGDWIELPEVI